ncbi:protein phosphatase 2C domain-containing protein [Ponticaulis profundi]|uniref:Protein phosphatase 2C domain-containing protein n=1 Tax=Ponticaulis profundi TaxID=2665222 RepID=A0ABW1SD15_9PROT
MSLAILETLNWPGSGIDGKPKRGTGDDRFGFDEAAGTAWVLDGATDVGPYRLFRREESDAAWYAEQLNRALIQRAPASFDSLEHLFRDAILAVRRKAEKASRVDLTKADKSAMPIASGIWFWNDGETATIVRMGDCGAILRTPDGNVSTVLHEEQHGRESETSKELNALSDDEKMNGLRRIRAQQNTLQNYPIFGLNPDIASHLNVTSFPNMPDTHVLLMSDGLYRLVDVYALYTPESLIERAIETGVEALAKEMRTHERKAQHDASIRIKSADDACAILLTF